MNVDLKSARSIFLAAVDEAPGEARTRYIDSACAGDEAMRREVLRLLNAFGDLNSFMKHPAAGPPPTVAFHAPEQVGATIGRYKLLEQIGEGGMGVVFVAEQTEPVRRRVALKIIKPGMDTRQVIARFEAERQALALMEHPNIAKVLDAGATETGRPYFAMELVRGMPITDYCDQAQLNIPGRLALFMTVCQAVQHAHQKGVIHRDIKPSNVMVTLHDGQPVIKVIDFGVAKAVNQQLTERTIYTAHAEMIGTPLYMSPEQAELSGLDVDTRSDVYSLGVLLYELLTGRTPFERDTLVQVGLDEIRRMIREVEPDRPSHRISTLKAADGSTISQRRGIDQRQLTRQIRGELDWIVMKALEKDRNRRYESASAVAADVERYLNNEPVEAGPPSALYRYRKFARRNRGALVAATVGMVLLVFAIAGLAVSSFLIANERDAAVTARNEATDHFQLARSAVDKLMTGVAEEQLLNAPKMEQLRNSLLTDALDFYQQMLQRDSKNPTLQHEVALAQRRVGDILSELGRRQEALAAHNDAIRRLRKLVASNPEVAEFTLSLADTLRGSSNTLRNLDDTNWRGEKDVAEQTCLEAVSLLEELNRKHPNNLNYQLALANAYIASAGWGYDERRKADALELAKKARAVIEPLARGPNATLTQKDVYANALLTLGNALQPAEEGRQALEDAKRIWRELVKIDPANQARRLQLAGTLWNSANFYVPEDQQEEVALRMECVSAYERVVADFPSVHNHRGWLAMAHMHLGIAYARERTEGKGRPNLAAALEQYAIAEDITEELIREYPAHKVYLDYLNMTWTNIANVQSRHGTTAEWLSVEEKIRGLYLRRAEELKNDELLLAAASREWWCVYKGLSGRGLKEEASKWAQYACEDLRALFARRPKQLPPELLEGRVWFPGELHNHGFTAEAAEFDEKLRPFLQKPDDLGNFLAARGKYIEAAAQYQAAVRQDTADYKPATLAAFVLLFNEDRTGYEAICRQMLDQFQETQDADAAWKTCFACSISPSPVGNLEQLVQLADVAVKGKDSADLKSLLYVARGLAAYRAGDFEGAIKWCAESRKHDEGLDERRAHSLLIDAMALHQLKRTSEALAAFDQATKHKDKAFPNESVVFKIYWFDWIVIELLRREAEALLQTSEADATHRQAALGELKAAGELETARGNFAEAARHYQAAAQLSPTDSGIAMRVAALLLVSGDRQGYEAVCHDMLERFASGDDPSAKRRTCSACLLSSKPIGDLELLVELADSAARRETAANLEYRERGLAAYRAGDWSGALHWSNQNTSGHAGEREPSRLVEAMALYRMHKRSEAIACYNEAVELMERNSTVEAYNFAMYELLRREAETLLQLSTANAGKQPPNQPSAPDSNVTDPND